MTDKNFDQMEMFAWWGVPTLFRCPMERDLAAVDIGLVGVPHSSGNGWNERDQHFGPRAMRDVSMGYRRVHREYKLSPWEQCRICDMGDTPLPNAMHNDQTIKDIQEFYMPLVAAGIKPVSIGGDHSVTLPILRALRSAESTVTNEPLAMVHFDAHHDFYDASDYGDKFLGNVEWAGAWTKIMCDEGLVAPKKVIQIGMRGHMDAETEGSFSEKAGYRVIEALEFHKMGPAAEFKVIREIIGEDTLFMSLSISIRWTLCILLAYRTSNPATQG
ncbi:arginase family protein [Pseudomonas sp. PMCC200344]|uniref:arginase family protein n=1 Tax=Pseudomonas sp. PMCC200344 TaxID=3042028 RepID=UPI0024B34C42|nr:arginase family protein [Pseudomonas sp. PMCC200344]